MARNGAENSGIFLTSGGCRRIMEVGAGGKAILEDGLEQRQISGAAVVS